MSEGIASILIFCMFMHNWRLDHFTNHHCHTIKSRIACQFVNLLIVGQVVEADTCMSRRNIHLNTFAVVSPTMRNTDDPAHNLICDFGFDLSITLDKSESPDDGTCASKTNIVGDTFYGDFSYTYAYTSDYYGYPAMMIEADGYWYYWMDLSDADFSGETGSLTYGFEDAYDYSDSNGRTWYYAYIQYGYAELTAAE